MLLAWVGAMYQIGAASMARADDLFIGPYNAGSSEATPFERYDTGDYSFLYAPDSNNDGIAGTFDAGLAGIQDALFFFGASIVRGALIAMQWMLGLDLYDDNATQIDTAVQDISNNLMIPLLGITLIVAGFSAYARFRRESGESIINEVAWIAAGGILAAAFALAPGTFIGIADGARSSVGQLVMKTYAAATTPQDENALGVSNGADMQGNPQCGAAGTCGDMTALNSSRRLTNALWDSWVNTPWCVAQFRNLETCATEDPNFGTSNAGVLLNPETRAELEQVLVSDYSEVNEGDKYEAWGGNDRWIRGMLGGRLGIVLVFFLVSIPMALFLLGLTLFGLMAAVGLLLLVLVGPFFLALWVIPGAPRRAGMQWLHGVLTVLLQSVLITLSIGAVAIVTAIINAQMSTYGYFISGLLNLVVLTVAWKMRSTLEGFHAAGGSGGTLGMTSSGMISSYTAWRVLGMGSRAARRTSGAARKGVGAVGGAADRASGGSGRGPLRGPHPSRRSARPLQSMHGPASGVGLHPSPQLSDVRSRPPLRPPAARSGPGPSVTAPANSLEPRSRAAAGRPAPRGRPLRSVDRPASGSVTTTVPPTLQGHRASSPATKPIEGNGTQEKHQGPVVEARRSSRSKRNDLRSVADVMASPATAPPPVAPAPSPVRDHTPRRSRKKRP